MPNTPSLRWRLFLPLLAMFAALAAGQMWHFMRERDQLKQDAAHELLNRAKLIAALQRALVAQADATLNGLMARPELGPGSDVGACRRAFAEQLRRETTFIQMGRIEPDGRLRCAAIPPKGLAYHADLDWFRQSLRQPGLVVSDVSVGRILNQPLIKFAKSMRDSRGRVVGTYYLSLDLGWLERELAAHKLPTDARLIVLDGQGTAAVLHPDLPEWAGRNAARLSLFRKIRDRGGEGTMEETGLDGRHRLFGFVPFLNTVSGRMYLILTLPREVAEAPAHRSLLVNLAISLGGLATGLALLLWAGHRLLMRPLLTLSRTAARLGGGDLDARSGLPHDDDEIGQLARTLDEAGAALRDHAERRENIQAALRLAAAESAAREQEFRSLADNVPANVARFTPDARALYLNPPLERALGLSAADLLGKTPAETHPDGPFAALEAAVRRVGAGGEAMALEQSVPGPDGKPRHHLIHLVAERNVDGAIVSVLTVGHDLTEQRKNEEALRLAACVFHNTQEGVMITDADTVILSVNRAFSEITGYSAAEAVGRRPSLLRSDHQAPEFYRALWRDLERHGRWEGEIWNRRKDGDVYLQWTTIGAVPGADGRPARYVSVFHDITETRRKDERIRHLAFHDPLTDLPNRALFQERLEHAIGCARRDRRRLSVTFIDLDGFKHVNDSLGHDIGDLLLKEIAERIRARLRRGADTVARLGGDEFVVLMEDLQETGQCASLATEIIAAIAEPATLRGHGVQVGASMGMAFFPEDGENAQELMQRADIAMYAAKQAGKGTYRFFCEAMLPTGPAR